MVLPCGGTDPALHASSKARSHDISRKYRPTDSGRVRGTAHCHSVTMLQGGRRLNQYFAANNQDTVSKRSDLNELRCTSLHLSVSITNCFSFQPDEVHARLLGIVFWLPKYVTHSKIVLKHLVVLLIRMQVHKARNHFSDCYVATDVQA